MNERKILRFYDGGAKKIRQLSGTVIVYDYPETTLLEARIYGKVGSCGDSTNEYIIYLENKY